jgi:hypothetical protein
VVAARSWRLLEAVGGGGEAGGEFLAEHGRTVCVAGRGLQRDQAFPAFQHRVAERGG